MRLHRAAGALAAVLLSAACIVAAACGSSDDEEDDLLSETPPAGADAPIVVAPDEPIRIGGSMVITGPNAHAGLEDSNSIVTAVNRWKDANGDEIYRHAIEVVVEDDGCTDVDATEVAAERLLRVRNLVGVIGPSCSAGTERVIDAYNDAGVVLITAAATRTDLTADQSGDSFFFRTIYRNDLHGRLAGTFARVELQASSAFLVDDGEPYGQDLVASAQAQMEALGVRVTRESVRRGQADFADLVQRIASAAPDFVAFGGFNPEAALFYSQLRDAGYDGPFGAGDAAASVEDFVEPVGADEAEGVYFAGCPLTLADDFASDYRETNDGDPVSSAFVAHTADATRILLDAVNRVAEEQGDGSLRIDRGELRDAVRSTHLTDGVSGHIFFDDRGDRATDDTDLAEQAVDLGWVACQVQGGRLVNTFP